MGCTQSKKIIPLKCPDNYEKGDFQKILALYDRLDKDGNFCIENEELDEISTLHIENLKTMTTIAIQNNNVKKEKVIKIIKNQHECDMQTIKNKQEETLKYTNLMYGNTDTYLKNQLDKFKNITKEKRINSFLAKVVNDENHIEFWRFFEYMKDRIHDIDNIKFQ